MSSQRLELQVFRFCAQKDYDPFYEKCFFEYEKEFLLLDVLERLPLRDFAYEKNVALRINGIAVFENLKITDLVENFGKEWSLEPISLKYALKDLTIDKEAVLSNYEAFFASADFLTPDERAEFSKYANVNFVSPQRNPDYFGDGFFLYVKWLLLRHPKEALRLLASIADSKNGVMNFVPTADFLYPRSDRIDVEIFDLQKLLLNGSKCPLKSTESAKIAKEVEAKFNFPSQPSSALKESGEGRAHLIFNGYDKSWNVKPLILSSAELLKKAGLKPIEAQCAYDGGYWGRFCNEEKFLLANAYNMALASKHGAVLTLCEEDAFANAFHAKTIIDSSAEILEKVNRDLAQYGLVYDSGVEMKRLDEMIVKEFDLEFTRDFSGFSSLLFHGSFASSLKKISFDGLFEKISLKIIRSLVGNESYMHLFDVNPDSALSQSAQIRYEALDDGVDFLLTVSAAQFETFDSLCKKSSGAYGRDFDPTPVLYLSQLVLLATGERDLNKIGLRLHKNKVNFI